MSHVVALEIDITDIDAMEQACKEVGLELHRDTKTYNWYGTWVNDYDRQDAAYKQGIEPKDYGTNAKHVISLPGRPKGSYEIGLHVNKEGKTVAVFDFFGSGGQAIEKVAGHRASKLMQKYSEISAKKILGKMKYLKQTTTVEADGTIVIRAKKSM